MIEKTDCKRLFDVGSAGNGDGDGKHSSRCDGTIEQQSFKTASSPGMLAGPI